MLEENTALTSSHLKDSIKSRVFIINGAKKNCSYPTPTFLMDVIVDTSHNSNFYDIAIYVPYCIV